MTARRRLARRVIGVRRSCDAARARRAIGERRDVDRGRRDVVDAPPAQPDAVIGVVGRVRLRRRRRSTQSDELLGIVRVGLHRGVERAPAARRAPGPAARSRRRRRGRQSGTMSSSRTPAASESSSPTASSTMSVRPASWPCTSHFANSSSAYRRARSRTSCVGSAVASCDVRVVHVVGGGGCRGEPLQVGRRVAHRQAVPLEQAGHVGHARRRLRRGRMPHRRRRGRRRTRSARARRRRPRDASGRRARPARRGSPRRGRSSRDDVVAHLLRGAHRQTLGAHDRQGECVEGGEGLADARSPRRDPDGRCAASTR